MKLLVNLLLSILLLSSASAQTELQKCSEEMNKRMLAIAGSGKGSDTSVKSLAKLDEEWRICVIGKQIPDFTIKTITGETISTEQLRGKVIVINFWFTTCPPCVSEIPALNQLVPAYKNVAFLGVAIDDKKKLKKFFKKHQFDFTIIPDGEPVETLFGVIAHPTTFIIDQYGKVSFAWAGGDTGEKAKTEAYLKAKPIIDVLLKAQ